MKKKILLLIGLLIAAMFIVSSCSSGEAVKRKEFEKLERKVEGGSNPFISRPAGLSCEPSCPDGYLTINSQCDIVPGMGIWPPEGNNSFDCVGEVVCGPPFQIWNMTSNTTDPYNASFISGSCSWQYPQDVR